MVTEGIGDAFGQERVTRDSTRLLRSRGHTVLHVGSFVRQSGARDEAVVIEGLFSLNSLSSRAKARGIAGRLAEALTRWAPDVIHFTDMPDPAILKAAAAVGPVVFTAHTLAATCPAGGRALPTGGECPRKSGWACVWHHQRQGCLGGFRSDLRRAHAVFEYLRRRDALRRVAWIAAPSGHVHEMLLRDGWEGSRVRLVPNPVEAIAGASALSGAPEVLISVAARLVPMKGIAVFLESLARLAGPWTAWICGDGPERAALEAMAGKRGISDRVKFLGVTAYERTQAIFASSRIVVQPNLGPEGFGLAVAEAGLLGIPVVASDLPALNEIVVGGTTGLLVPPGDPGVLAAALARLLADPQAARRMGAAARESVKARYSAGAHLDALVDLYGAASGGRRHESRPARAVTVS